MTLNRRGQVAPGVLLIAAACAGIWYGGYYTVKGAKAAGHWVAKPFHHHKLPLVHQAPKQPNSQTAKQPDSQPSPK